MIMIIFGGIAVSNNCFDKIVGFSQRHRWAKYPCVCAAAAVYVGQAVGEKFGDSEFRGRAFKRIASVAAAAAFMSMTFPAAVFAEENYTETAETKVSIETEALNYTPKSTPWESVTIKANGIIIYNYPEEQPAEEADEQPTEEVVEETAEEITDAEEFAVTVKGLPDEDPAYSVELDCGELTDNITVEMLNGSSDALEAVQSAFESYDIPTDHLNIMPVEINMYDGEGAAAQLGEGEKAVVTLPLPDDMQGHTYDLRVVRVDDGGIVILDSDYSEDGTSLSFETQHFSVFALVAYSDDEAEDMSSHAGADGSGMPISSSDRGGADIWADMKWRTPAKKRKFRIVKAMKKADLIF